MSNPFHNFDVGVNGSDGLPVEQEEMTEMMQAMQVMLASGLPPEQIIQRIIEKHRPNDLPMQEYIIREAQDAFRQFLDKYQKAQRVVLKSYEDDERVKDLARSIITNNSTHGRVSRPQSRGIPGHLCELEAYSRVGNDHGVEELSSEHSNKPSFYVVRAVSEDELRAAVLKRNQEPLQATLQELKIDDETNRDFEILNIPSEGFTPIPSSSTLHRADLEEDIQRQYLQESLCKGIPLNTKADADLNENVAEKLVENTPPVEASGPKLLDSECGHLENNVRSHQHRPSSPINCIPTPPQPDPPIEHAVLAGGEGGQGASPQLQSPSSRIESREVPHSSSSRSSHRSSNSATRVSNARKRIPVKKKDTTDVTTRRNWLLGASLLGFGAIGGYILYKNKFKPFQF